MIFISTRYSVICPRSTLTRFERTSSPVMLRSVRAARSSPSSTASRNPSGDEAMISVTRATATSGRLPDPALAAQNLLRRFFLETTGQGQRLRREVA